MAKVLLAAGGGFVGRSLAKRFADAGYEVVSLVRRLPKNASPSRYVLWDGKTLGDWAGELEGAELLINLAGRSVDCRYNEKNKKEIFDSRTDSTEVLGLAIQQAKTPPPLWINSSTATIYRHAEDRPMDEFTGEIGSGFSVEVAKKWEKTFFGSLTPKTRKVALRSAIVLGKEGGALTPFGRLVRLGLGGTQGNGRQMFSWIHEEDLFEIIRFIQAGDMDGVVNCAAPTPLLNREIMKALRQALHVPIGLPAPAFLLTIGAWFLRTETELLLKSRWVVPTRLIKAGYRFKYTTIQEALADLF